VLGRSTIVTSRDNRRPIVWDTHRLPNVYERI